MVSCLQLFGEKLNDAKVKNICEALNGEHLRMLSIRECKVTDKDFRKIIKNVSTSKSILQLSLNVGIIKDHGRVKILANALQKNRSLISLLVNGNPFGDEGMKTLGKALSLHPNIVSLDVGDCCLGNDSIEVISDLLPPNGAKPGLTDLTMSANSDITPKGWSKLAVAIAASSTLRELYLDYNTLGDYAASCILVALTAHRRIEVLDLEGTGITDHTAQLMSYLVDQYPVRLRKVVLDENKINGNMKEAIKSSICWSDETTSETQSETGTDISKSEVSVSREVKVHPVDTKELTHQNKNETLLGMFSAVSEKSREEGDHSDFKDTAATDEDYKALAKALEAGLDTDEREEPLQSTGGMSPMKEEEEDDDDGVSDNDNEGSTIKSEDGDATNAEEESDEGEELQEVPVVSQSKIVYVATSTKFQEVTGEKKIPNIGDQLLDDDVGQEEDQQTTKEEELQEVPVRKP